VILDVETPTPENPVSVVVDLNRLSWEHNDWDAIEGRLRLSLPSAWTPPQMAHALADAALQLGQIDAAIAYYREAIEANPQNFSAYVNLIFLMDAQATTTDADAAAIRLQWWEQFGRQRYEARTTHTNTRDPEKRLRVGYIGGDWRFHSSAFGCHHIIRGHSDQIEPVFYSTLPPHAYDATTKAMWVTHPAFVDVSGHPAAEVARIIQADGIDILVDLSGYTAGNALLSFTHKPAPIQITGWGYATGVGWPGMDVLFGDPITMANYPGPERVVHLPSVISFNPRPDLPDANTLPCLTKPPVFAVYQRALKLNRSVLETYAKILTKLPDSTIIFKAADYSQLARSFIADCMPDNLRQIKFLPATANREHQLLYQEADICLDPWPQTGGISTLEAAWMGVPTVTLIGPRIIQRASAALMTTMGLPDFVTETTEDYVNKAVAMVTYDRHRLSAIRATLRETLAESPIMTGYVDRVEEAYRMLWREYCEKGSVHG
jgi:predicted O-linked N-acetylglucosamine transferase (SPINDLY family)